MNNLHSLTHRRKITALDKHVKELGEVTTTIKSAMQMLSKYNEYSNIRHRVNDLFVLYQEVKAMKQKKLEILERLKNEQEELEG